MSNMVSRTDKNKEIKLSVKDTDFLLKIMLEGTFKGSELEHANAVLQKLVKMHKILMNA